MPNPIRVPLHPSHFAKAVRVLKEYFAGLPGAIRELSPDELSEYSRRRAIAGWCLEVSFDDTVRSLDLLLDDTFPYALPRVALVDRPPPFTWPHIEEDGILCLFPESTRIASHAPVDVVRYVLGTTVKLIETNCSSQNQDDFKIEFLSYWNRCISSGSVEYQSLIDARPPSRIIRVWYGRKFYIFGEEESSVQSWVSNISQETNKQSCRTEPALLLWLKQPLFPHEYPTTAAQVYALIHSADDEAIGLFEHLAASAPRKITVLLAAPTPHGPCFAGVIIPAPPQGQLTRGFRPTKAPPKILADRFFCETKVIRSKVNRVDASWIHGRGHDIRQPTLGSSRVAILGCGSVGAPVAFRLAEAGVGHLIFVDPEKLDWANIGRHPLGSRYVGASKAEALAAQLRNDYPHIGSVNGYMYKWQDVAASTPNLLTECDLIISTIGHWNTESSLNAWHLTHEQKPPILYGWTEPYASAGHAVAIVAEGGCLQCGFDSSGQPLLRITDWPDITEKQEPACGVFYQPYGPVELAHIEAMIAEMALEILLGDITKSHHRMWVGRQKILQALGGTWNFSWCNMADYRPEGGILVDRSWARINTCTLCGQEVCR